MNSYIQWVTVRETVHAANNQHPGHVNELFQRWVDAGWVIVSVTVFPPTSVNEMCVTVGVLTRETR